MFIVPSLFGNYSYSFFLTHHDVPFLEQDAAGFICLSTT
jgi:hypothetical protein